jgi:hypothetical protein
VVAIAAGEAHTCALRDGGGVKCWGANDAGQLGDGTTIGRPTAVHVNWLTSGVAAVAADGSHTCARTTAGGARCWGANDAGQLGDGTTTSRLTAVHVSGLSSGVTAIAAGGSTSPGPEAFAASTTSTLTTTTTTTTLAGCGGVPDGPTFASIDCRLASFVTAVRAEPALGTLAAALSDTPARARANEQDAEVLCAVAGAKRAGNRLRQAEQQMAQYVHRLRGRHARHTIPAALRAPLEAAGRSIQSDLRRLRQGLDCPAR